MIINKYRFGSHVYGTQTPVSDEDFICVTHEKTIATDINTHYYTVDEFQRLLNNHEIQMLECYFLPEQHVLQEMYKDFTFSLDKGKLRINISTITSNSWVRGKKKLIVQGDYDKYLAIKSVFHAIRILGLGIQLADTGGINNYSEYNWVHTDLLKMAAQWDQIELWEKIDDKYRKLFNKLNSEFKKLCPKITIPEHRIKQDLIQLFREHHCYTEPVVQHKLVEKIIRLFQSY